MASTMAMALVATVFGVINAGHALTHDFVTALRQADKLNDMCAAPVTGRLCCCFLRHPHPRKSPTSKFIECAGGNMRDIYPPRVYLGDSGNMNLFMYGAVALGGMPAPDRKVLVLDVGAAYGAEALVALKAGYSVVSLEARSDEAHRLRGLSNDDPNWQKALNDKNGPWAAYVPLKNYERNHSFTVLQAAAGKAAGMAKLALGAGGSSLSHEAVDKVSPGGRAITNNPKNGAVEKISDLDNEMGEIVPVVTIDDVVDARHSQGNTNRVALLKIDVQG